MPEMDGVELVQLVRKNPALQGLPVILVSGLGDQEIEAKAAAVGADDVLRKPFTAETLIPKVERLLAKGARSSVRAPIPEGIPEVAISLDPIPLLRKLRSVAGVLGAALVERASGRVIASDGFDPGQADLAARHLAPLSPLLDPLGETTSHRNLRSIILQFGDGFVVVYRAGHVDVLLSLSDARQLGLLHYLVRKSLPDLLAS
jgi:CheY-like chemotaxis protein